MKRRKRFCLGIRGGILCVAFCAVFMLKSDIKAAEAEEGGMNYSVKPIMPDNQRDETDAYFDILMEPGTEQELEVEILNNGEEDKTFNISIATATTNASGNVEYGERTEIQPDDTLRYHMEDLVSTEGRFTVPAGETKKATMKVLIPSESFDGVLAGGINIEDVTSKGKEEDAAKEEGGVNIKNVYTYAIALLIRVNENEVTPEMQLNQVYATQVNWRNAVSANLQNIHAAYIQNLRIDTKIRKKGENTTLYEITKTGMKVAPNSNFNFMTPLEGEAFQAGTYVLTLNAESDQGKWEFEKEFKITEEDARKLNETDVTIEESKLWIYASAGGGLLVLIILIFIVILSRKKAKKQRKRTSKIVEDMITGIKGNDESGERKK